MKFNWKDTLRRLTGSETGCPVCGADGLMVRERTEHDLLPNLRGRPFCTCPHCHASGELAPLVASAAGKTLEETVRDLRTRSELEAAGRDADAYVASRADQDAVDIHFARCVARMREAPHLGGIRAGLSVANLRQLPPDTGLFVPTDAPRHFALLQNQRYSRVPMTLYRYRFDDETTCIDAQNPKTLQREHRLRVTGDVGVYLGDYGPGEVPPVLVGTHNPRIAAQVYGALRAETSRPSPVVGIAGFPLPHRFSAVRTLYLIDAPDAPLPLAFAIRALSVPTVYGSDICPMIRVLQPHGPSSDITAADIRVLSDSHVHGRTLESWIAERILGLADSREEVANALLQAGATEGTRALLVDLLGDRPPAALVETIMLPTTEPDDVFALGNGRLVKATPIGLYAAARDRKTDAVVPRGLLCNVGVAVDLRIADHGKETACCTVTHPDPDVPSIPVRIPRAHWNSPDLLAEDIRAAYADCGRTPYVAFYRVQGYAWADILQYLGSHCPVQTGLKALGATADGTVNLPNAVLARGTARAQTKAGLLDAEVLHAYEALAPETVDDGPDRLLHFLGTEASLDRTGVAAGLLHTLYCTAGVQFDRSGVRRPPSHLVFVETEPGIWDSTLRTLAYLFSGSEYVPPMDYSDRPGFLGRWAGLGTLPLVTRLPSADDIATVLAGSPVPVIAVADPLTAVSLSGRGTVSFVLPHVEATEAGLSPNDVASLRTAFVSLTARKCGTGWMDIGGGGPSAASTPGLSVLASLTDERRPETVAGGLYRSVKGRYPGAGLTGARAFLGVLHRAYVSVTHGDTAGIALTLVAGTPANALKASFNERGEHVFVCTDHVIVSRSVVQLINREKTYLFDAEQLSREFSENGIIEPDVPKSLGLDGRRVWVFPRSVWDDEVVRGSGFTNRKDKRK